MKGVPAPPTTPMLGHLWRWTRDPVRLLADGARTGPVFQLRLWRPVLVGYRPQWNRTLLSDLDTFRSRGSLSAMTPYLAAGVVHLDVPGHGPRRRELNPHFHARTLAPLADRLRDSIAADLPTGPVEAVGWANRAVRRMLNAAFFAGRVPDELLAAFLAPLQRRPPSPLLPRPVLFHRLDAAVTRVMADPPEGTIAHALAGTPDAVAEIRVALAAGYDTTAHTLAWTLWHLAGAPQWRDEADLDTVLDEILRLYPAGWLGSRVAACDAHADGVDIPTGTMVLYSPFLSHRDPLLWPDPAAFRPERFAGGRPAWGFIPFSAGRRTCLGVHLARLMLRTAVSRFGATSYGQLTGDPSIRSGITLRPAGPLWIERVTRAGPAVASPRRVRGGRGRPGRWSTRPWRDRV